MGAHSTAWIAHLDAVRRHLINTSIDDGKKWLIDLAKGELEDSPLRELIEFLGKEHADKLKKAEDRLKESIEEADKDEDHKKAIQRLINSYLTYVNYLPMATVKGGDPGGHGEGTARGNINLFEFVSTRKREYSVDFGMKTDEYQKLYKEAVEKLNPKGIQGLIKKNAKGEDFSKEKLKDELIKQLWTLFAAETPLAFAKDLELDDEQQKKVWMNSIKSFLNTIRLAYPHTYEYVAMHTTNSQQVGLEYALKEAKLNFNINEMGIDLPISSDETEVRTDLPEVALSDFYQSGTGFQVSALLKDGDIVGDIDLIGAVEMIGRTKSPFSGTMGAHTTAWIAHLDAVSGLIVGQKVFQAIQTLGKSADQAMDDEGLDLAHLIDEKHQIYLISAYSQLSKTKDKIVEMKDVSVNNQVLFLEEFILQYLTFVNYLPLSTIAAGSVPGGLQEGKYRQFLLNYERLGSNVFIDKVLNDNNKKILQDNILGLFDESGMDYFPPELVDRENTDISQYVKFDIEHDLYYKINANKSDNDPDPKKVAYARFYQTILEAYPRSAKDSDIFDNDHAKNIAQEHEQKIRDNETKKLEELRDQGDCLINAIKKSAFNGDNKVNMEDLWKIRFRINHFSNMVQASERTITVLCDVLNIKRGVVIFYYNKPCEDFGDTSSDPLLIQHTGINHFEPYKEMLQVKPLETSFQFELTDDIQCFMNQELENLFSESPSSDNFFMQLRPLLPKEFKLSIQAQLEDGEEYLLNIEGNAKPLPLLMDQIMSPQLPQLLLGESTPALNSKKRKASDEELDLQPQPKKFKFIKIVLKHQKTNQNWETSFMPPEEK